MIFRPGPGPLELGTSSCSLSAAENVSKCDLGGGGIFVPSEELSFNSIPVSLWASPCSIFHNPVGVPIIDILATPYFPGEITLHSMSRIRLVSRVNNSTYFNLHNILFTIWPSWVLDTLHRNLLLNVLLMLVVLVVYTISSYCTCCDQKQSELSWRELRGQVYCIDAGPFCGEVGEVIHSTADLLKPEW